LIHPFQDPGVNELEMAIARRLRGRRLRLGLPLSTLASACGVTFQQVQKYETGQSAISASRLWALSRVLEVDIGYFFEGFGAQAHPGGPRAQPPADGRADGERVATDSLPSRGRT
jgi:transcriptional regulator with XRE-family HTH domain